MKRYPHSWKFILAIALAVAMAGLSPGLSNAKDYPVTFLKETYKT